MHAHLKPAVSGRPISVAAAPKAHKRAPARPRALPSASGDAPEPFSGAADARSATTAAAARRVHELRKAGADLYSNGEALAPAVSELVASNQCARPGPASLAAEGSWEVFHAPHIARLSAALGARFQPIRYTLRGGALISNVRYRHPLLGTGWLSASGTLAAADHATLQLAFDRFWVDLGEGVLRPELPPAGASGAAGGGMQAAVDACVGVLGRAAFLPSLARFPVEQLDVEAGLAVFRFPPLASSIAVARVAPAAGDAGGGAAAAGDALPG